MNCKYCNSTCKKNGKQKNNNQKYQCRSCKKYQQIKYAYHAYTKGIEESIIRHVKRSNGIRDIAYLLKISPVTVIHKIRSIASSIKSTYSSNKNDIYEMDELRTFTSNKNNDQWLLYAINKCSRRVVDIIIGKRNTINIKKIVDKVLTFHPKTIYTDRLNIYPGLIDSSIHKPGRYLTNCIERMNLTFRTHLKRLSRSTLCYSKKADMLEACVKIYVWA